MIRIIVALLWIGFIYYILKTYVFVKHGIHPSHSTWIGHQIHLILRKVVS